MIHRALGDPDAARDYLGRALALNRHFHILQPDVAARALADLGRTAGRGGGRR